MEVPFLGTSKSYIYPFCVNSYGLISLVWWLMLGRGHRKPFRVSWIFDKGI